MKIYVFYVFFLIFSYIYIYTRFFGRASRGLESSPLRMKEHTSEEVVATNHIDNRTCEVVAIHFPLAS